MSNLNQLINTSEKLPVPKETVRHIYDKVFKRILTLSNKAVIHMINGVFHQDYAQNSKITYNWTEHVDNELKKTLADTIITINDVDGYHMEAQMYGNERLGNITKDDARCLRRLTLQLYQHIYDRYEELEERGVSDMVEEALVLDIDVINYEHKKAMEELAREKDEALEQKEKVLVQRENEIKAMRMLMKHLPQQEIMKETGLSQEELQALLA